jgi:hypothetical protein
VVGTITSTVIVSALTSAAVSVITFVIGVRVSKDQGDRPVLRALYETLFQHFRGLREAIKKRRPKIWRDFPLEGDRYTPPFAKMNHTGEASLIPDALAHRCDEVESEALIAGGKHIKWVSEVLIPLIRKKATEKAIRMDKSISGRSCREIHASALSLMNEEELHDVLSGVGDGGLGVGLQLSLERGRSEVLYMYSENMKAGTVVEAVSEIWQEARSDKDAEALRLDLEKSANTIGALLHELTARIRDPHPLFESVRRSLADALRGK